MSDDDRRELPSLESVTEWEDGFSWIPYPDERPRRACHAIATESGVWVVDPIDVEGLDDRLSDLGTVAGVVVLLDRHTRDAAAVARRHNVSVHMPEWMELGAEKLEGEAELLTESLPETSFDLHRLIDTDDWEEAILYSEQMNALVVPEAVGTSPGFRPDGEALGVHPGLDESPTRLANWSAERILVGHGESVHENGTEHLEAALSTE
jgi:hypothetical protein